MGKRIIESDLVGRIYGRLEILKLEIGIYNPSLKRRVRCQCTCGNQIVCLLSNLQCGHVTSCGCFARESSSARNSRHRLRHSLEYPVWVHMKQRCRDKHIPEFPDYGGRGITVCGRWLHSFENFLADMGPRPSLSHSIDRIDNDGPYSPDNCRWATLKEQNRNKRTNHLLEFNGQIRNISEWAEIVQIPAGSIARRIKNGWSVMRALTAPRRRQRNQATHLSW